LVTQAIICHLFHSFVLNHLPDDSPYLYSIRKVTGSVITLLAALLLFGVWVQRLGDLSVAFGCLAAGLAFALQEVIGSIAGWITIITGKPFTTGD
jgi:small-conductance mechanosensitive channel